MRKVPLHRVAIKPKWDCPSCGRTAPCRIRMCPFFRTSEIEEFTSLSSASIHLLLHFSSWPHVTSRALSRFRSAGRIGRISWPHVAPPLIFLSAVYPVHPLPRGFNVHAKQTAATARLSIIRYIRLWPSNSSLTTLQTWREKERGSWRRKIREMRLPALCQGAPKIHGTTKIARRCQRRRRRGRDWRRRGDARWKPGESFRESYLVFQHSRHTSLAEDSPPFVLLCISKRASSTANSVCVISSPPNVSELQMRADRRNTSRGGGSSIETGREFRSASSRIYLKTPGCGETENVGIGARERNRRDNGVNRNRKKNLRPTLLWKFQRNPYNFSRILDVGPLTLGNKRRFLCSYRAKVTSQTSWPIFLNI